MSDIQPTTPPEPEPEPISATPAFATLVATDGRLVRLLPDGGGVSLAIEGRKAVTLDRFQTMALRAAVAAMPEA